MVQVYASGFVFDQELNYALLLEKQRPEHFKGLLFPVGGKVEAGETPKEAMEREFMEEAGIEGLDWQIFLHLEYPREDISVYFYRAISNEGLKRAYTKTDEQLGIYKLENHPIFKPFALYTPVKGYYKDYPYKADLPVLIETARMLDPNAAHLERYL